MQNMVLLLSVMFVYILVLKNIAFAAQTWVRF